MSSTVLVIDDEVQIRRLLRIVLEGAGYKVVEAENGILGIQHAAGTRPDIVLLDMGLPDMSGLTILARLREWSRVPVIVLTVQNDEADKISALDGGADDYVTKPFDPLVLRARLRNALRRAAPAREAPKHVTVRFADCACDPLARTVTHAQGRSANFTEKEIQLFMALARRAGEVVDRDELSRLLTGGEWSPLNRALDVHVSNLRRKLMTLMQAESVITSFRGIGYMLRASVRIDE